MGIKFDGELKMDSIDKLMKKKGIQDNGPVQKYIDNEVIAQMIPYTPMVEGYLSNDAPRLGTDIGSGIVAYNSPAARYLYYGKLMVSSITGSAWSKGEKKVLTDVDLQYNKSAHPQAGKLWFERMKTDHADDIEKGAQEITGKESKK